MWKEVLERFERQAPVSVMARVAATGGVDAFADHGEGLVKADDDGFRFRFNDSASHS